MHASANLSTSVDFFGRLSVITPRLTSPLIAAVESGEEVIIARNGKPAVKLVLANPPVGKRVSHIGKICMADGAFSPKPISRSRNSSKLTTPPTTTSSASGKQPATNG